eukprot:1114781-Prymnesium_polylepis.1
MVSALKPRSTACARHLATSYTAPRARFSVLTPAIHLYLARRPRATGDWLKQRSHRLERMPQAYATAGLAACEHAVQSASL